MEGVGNWFYTNRLLEKSGLAVLDSKGTPVPSSSKVIATGDGASIYINTTAHKDGIVPPEQKDQVISQVKNLLLSYKDQKSMGVINKLYTPKDAPEVGLGGPKGADLMIDFRNGYAGKVRGGTAGTIVQPIEPIGLGMHGGWPYEPRLRAVFYAAGPAFAKGKKISPIRTIDIAPTVSRILGIRKPAQAVGRGSEIVDFGPKK
jgi:predicted AlkP superfamily phosphohydrolase/phosphomutase